MIKEYLHLTSKYLNIYVWIYQNDFILQGEQQISWGIKLSCMEEKDEIWSLDKIKSLDMLRAHYILIEAWKIAKVKV